MQRPLPISLKRRPDGHAACPTCGGPGFHVAGHVSSCDTHGHFSFDPEGTGI